MLKIIAVTLVLFLVTPEIEARSFYKCYIDGQHAFQQLPCPPGTNIKDQSETLDRDVEIREMINEMIRDSSQFKIELKEAMMSEYGYEGSNKFEGKYGVYYLDDIDGTVTIEYDTTKLGLPNVGYEPGSLTLIYTALIQNHQISWLCHALGNSTNYAPSYCLDD